MELACCCMFVTAASLSDRIACSWSRSSAWPASKPLAARFSEGQSKMGSNMGSNVEHVMQSNVVNSQAAAWAAAAADAVSPQVGYAAIPTVSMHAHTAHLCSMHRHTRKLHIFLHPLATIQTKPRAGYMQPWNGARTIQGGRSW